MRDFQLCHVQVGNYHHSPLKNKRSYDMMQYVFIKKGFTTTTGMISFDFICPHKNNKETYLHYYIPSARGEDSESSCSHCAWYFQFNNSVWYRETYLHYYIPSARGEDSESSCSHCAWYFQFNNSVWYRETYLHYYIPSARGEDSQSSCSHCAWYFQFNNSVWYRLTVKQKTTRKQKSGS